MECPTCRSTLEPNARFCGVCGYRMAMGQSLGRGESDFGAEDDLDATQIDPMAMDGGFEEEEEGDPFIGLVLNNRFTVEDKLGEGGFGAVYRGVQSGTRRKVAIKVLHPEMSGDEHLVKRFKREGLVLCNLRDAHTVTTYDFDQTPEGMLYIAMELLEGRSLHDVFKSDAPIGWKRMFKIASQMCSSLAEAHAQGIVHRDLKPENIYLEDRPGHAEFVKILDFGIAKLMRGDGLSSQSPQLTATGQTLGTLEYMSPEQLMGKELDGRSDVYAVGVLIYELITGRLPFPDAKGPAGLITAQLRHTPDPPSQANPNGRIPKAVDELVLKMLAKDKDARYADVNELREELNRLMYQAEPAATPSAADRSGPVVMGNAPGMPQDPRNPAHTPPPGMPQAPRSPANTPPPGMPQAPRNPAHTPPPGVPMGHMGPGPGAPGQPYPGAPMGQGGYMPSGPATTGANPLVPPGHGPLPGQPYMPGPGGQPYMNPPGYPQQPNPQYPALARAREDESSKLWIWIIAIVVLAGGGVGAFFAFT